MEGSLREFSVAEVFQFVSLHEGDGVLVLTNKNERATFGFKGGKVVGAMFGKEGLLEPLEDYIVKFGKMSIEDLSHYKEQSEQAGISLDELLLREGKITSLEIQPIIKFKIQEIVDEVLTWQNGKYKFIQNREIYPNSKISVSIEPNSLIMEGMRRIDEWPRIHEEIPDDSVQLIKSGKPKIEVELGDEEKRILMIFEDGMDVGKIVKLSGLGKFRTYSAIFNLMEMGILRKIRGEKIEVEPVKRKHIDFVKLRRAIELILLYSFFGFSLSFFFSKKFHLILSLLKSYFQ